MNGKKKTGMTIITPTDDADLPRRYADFPTLVDAVEYAASGVRGMNFYSSRGDLKDALTYKEMRDRAVEIGRRLSGLGVEKGDRIALIADTSSDFICFFVGAQYVSVLPVPLPLPTSFGGRDGYVDQLARQLESCGASVVITPENMKDLTLEAAARFDMKFAGTPEEFEAVATELADLRLPEPDDLSYLQYSSGSTRFPHGISVTHRSLMVNCRGMGFTGVQIQDGDRCVSWLPFYHDMGLVGMFLTSLTCQVSADYLSTEDFARRPLMWLSIMSRNKGTVTYSPTFGYDICARRIGPDALAQLDLSHCRVAGIGGDMVRPDVMAQFSETFAPAGFDARALMPSYGLAECTLAVSFMPAGRGIETDLVDEAKLSGKALGGQNSNSAGNSNVLGHKVPNGNGSDGDARFRAMVNCGVPLPDYELEIRAENGALQPDHEIGRVFVRGESVMQGYYNDEEATRQVLSPDGWLDTGDMGYMLDSSLFIVGRSKDLIIVNGKNHWPQDIEWAAEQLPGIRNGDIAAISVPGEDQEEVLAVLVHCRLREDMDRQEFAEQVKSCILDATGVNCRIELVPPRTLPRTSSGKLARAKARTNFLDGDLAAPSDRQN